MRIKYADDAKKFMESELELNNAIQVCIFQLSFICTSG